MKNFNFFEKLWEHGRTLRRVGLVLVMCLMAIPQLWGYSMEIYFCPEDLWGGYWDEDTKYCQLNLNKRCNGNDAWETYSMTKTAWTKDGKAIWKGNPTNLCNDGAQQIQFLRKLKSDNYQEWSDQKYDGWMMYNSTNTFYYGSWQALSKDQYVNGGYVYFDNSQTGWTTTYKYLVIGRDAYSRVYALTRISNTDLWYVYLDGETNHTWEDATYCAFIGSDAEWGDGDFGPSTITDASKYTATYPVNYSNSILTGRFYLYRPASSENGTELSRDNYAAYSGLNWDITFKAKIKAFGEDSYAEGTSKGKVSVKRYTYGNATSCGSSASTDVLAVGGTSGTYAMGYVSTRCTLTVANVVTGYTFRGWYAGGTKLSDDTPYRTYSPRETTVYAYFEENSYTITYNNMTGATNHPSNPSSYGVTSSTITLQAPTKDGYVFAGWCSDAGCTTRVTSIPTGSTGNKVFYAKWLSAHEPGKYETATGSGGYGKTLKDVSGVGGYERYVFGVSSSKVYVGADAKTTSTGGACVLSYATATGNFDSGGEWLSGTAVSNTSSATTLDITGTEFASCGSVQGLKHSAEGQGLLLNVKGYTEFAIVAMDNDATKGNKKYLQVLVNGSDVTDNLSTDKTRRSYSLTAGTRYTIQIKSLSSSENQFWGFSLKPGTPTITSSSLSGAEYAQGASATPLSVTATKLVSSGTSLSYQWYANTTNEATVDNEHKITGATSASYTPPTTSAGTKYYYCVVSETGCNSTTSSVSGAIIVTAACSATAPGSISKGSASGGTGTIRLTAAGSAATNNTWYWQSAADGTATNLGSGATKDVSATGTYYLRSYCSDNGGCWSDAVFVEVSAEDLLTTPTATFSNGVYTIGSSALDLSSLWSSNSEGSVTYTVQSAGSTGASISTAAFTATTAGTATVRASQAANGNYSAITKDATITVSNPTYSVTYKANNSTAESDVVEDAESTFGDNPSFTAPSTKAFAGWNTKADGSGTHYDVGDAVPSAITVYAEWRYKVYYIASSASESNDVTTALASKYVVSKHTTTATSYNASDYSDYALVVLSESLDGSNAGTNDHELKVIVGLNKPILNLKTYFYGADGDASKRWKWGAPNAGKKPKCIYVKNSKYANLTSHPIYSGLTLDGSDSIQILKTPKTTKPIQPIGSFASGKEGYTLALVPNNSSGSGTAIHEMTAEQRSNATGGTITSKYLMISIQSGELSNLSDDGKKLIQNAADYLITGSQWVPQYAITKSATNGSIETEVSSSAVTSAAEGSRVDITAIPTSGYDFSSWSVYKTDDAETTVSVNSTTTSPTYFTMPAYAVTVAATFVESGYTISFEGNGNTSGSMSDVTEIEEGDNVTLAANGFTKNGYSFANWTADVDVTINSATVNTGDPIADGATIENVSSDITLTAVWTPNTYDITYHENGASYKAGYTAPATYTVGTGATLPVAGDMINTGYTFGGWFADDDLKTGGVKTEVGTSEYGNKEFWAKWTENTYTITYNANGDGAGNVGDATGSTSSTNGHYVTVADNGFALEDHVFAGWNTAANGSGDSYGEGDEIELTGNMTLYAIWATDYDISWGNAQYGGADETPNLGGGNYTITASVATWTGTLTTDMISAVSDGVMITNVAVDNSASPKTITATFDVGASVAGTTIKLQLDVPAYGVYGAKSSEESITIDRCSGGVDASTVVFSQNFSSDGAGSVAYAANTAREYKSGGTTITGIVGSGTNEFTYIGQTQKDNCGVAVNSSTGGNSVNATGIFQAYCNNTGGKYALVKNSNFAATAPTALKVSMKIWFQQGSSGSDYSVTFAVGDGFSNSTSAPDATNVHSGFSILNNSNACLYPYKSNKTALSGTNKLTQGSDLTMVWVINNSGQTLSYTDPASNTSTLANDKFDVWVGTTRFIAGASATTASKTLQNLYIGDPAGKKHQLRLDDIVVTDISPAVSSITPTLTWDDGDLDIASVGVTKEEGDADFTFTASQNKNSLGAITYSSSNTSVATVNASGKVHIVGNGSTTITASIAESGCYKDADVSYSLTVNEKACADAAGTIKDNDGNTIAGNAITKSSCETVTLKLVGYTDGANIQWYKDGEAIDGATAASYTVPTSGSGVYSAISSKTCDRNSTNEITVTNSASVSATKIVDSWYVKAGRRTPDIALVQTMDAASFQVKISSTVIWSTVSGSEVTTGLGGCGFYLGKDGIIYLKGTKSNGNATDDILENKTLSFVVTNACSTNASDPGNITIKRQAATDRPSVAYVSLGTKGGAVTDTTAGYYKTAALYKYLDHTLGSGAFDLTAQNIYWTTNEKMLREHYSQFDAILITDDPSTKTVPSGVSGEGAYKTKGYVNALGCLVDIRPILTMEAYVSALANWKTKGINGDPTSPNPRQYSMKLQCKDHEIFGSLSVGDNVVQTTVDGTNYWSVKMVDNTKSPYSGLADDEKTSGKGSIPALQGFAASDVSGLLLLGQISDGAYHAGVERQEEPAARLMLLGLNNQALPNALTQEGKIVIKNALTYLLKTNMEEVDDCSNYFTGATSTDWNTPSNWFKGVVPNSPMVRARILAPCEITGITVKAAQIDIVTSGTSSKKAGELTGKLTINPTGALIVGGKIRAAEAPYYSIEDLKPTEEEDLVLNTNSSNQAALIFDNEDGDTKATVNLYSLGRKESGSYYYQYMAVPMESLPVNPSFAGSGIYTYVWNEASGWERRGYYTDLYAFEGVGITTKFADSKTYEMKGTLASTETREIALTNDKNGQNMIGNSWTAPIQIADLEEDNSASEITQTVYIYSTGNGNTVSGGTTASDGQWLAIPFSAAGFEAWDGLKVIPAMQTFNINVTGTSMLTLDYDKVVRKRAAKMSVDTLTTPLHAPKRSAAHEGVELMRIRVEDSQTHTDLYLFKGERFSDEFDNGWEAEYLNGDGRSAKLYAQTEIGKMAVVATDELEGMVLGFEPGKETEYTFTFGGEGMGYYLNDLKLKKSTWINAGETYSFTYEEGDINRFIISTTPITTIMTGCESVGAEAAKVRKVIIDDKVYIIRIGHMYSVDGQMVK